MSFDKSTTAVLAGGGVEYSAEDAAIEIDALLRVVEDMKADGITHVVMSSGNYRGAQWASIRDHWNYADDED